MLDSLHSVVWKKFQELGYQMGENFCVIDAFLIILKQIEPRLQRKVSFLLDVLRFPGVDNHR